jgi:hypothetical protein
MACSENNFLGEAWSSLFGGPEDTCVKGCDSHYANEDVRRKGCRTWCNAQCPKQKTPNFAKIDDMYAPENLLDEGELHLQQVLPYAEQFQNQQQEPDPTISYVIYGSIALLALAFIGAGIYILKNSK